MGMVLSKTSMAIFIKANGSLISEKDRALRNGLMDLNSLVPSCYLRSRGMGGSIGLMDPTITGTSRRIR